MDEFFTTFRAIEKRRHQTHKSRRAIIFSRFSRNVHNIMAMAIQYTSNSLSADLVVHQLIFFTAFQLHLHRFLSPNLYKPFVSSNPPFYNYGNQFYACSIAIIFRSTTIETVPGSTVIATVLARHGTARF